MREIVNKGTVFLLKACYKNNDDEELGAFEDMESLLAFFARVIVEDHKGESEIDIAEIVALRTADLCGEGDADECIDGWTRSWIHEMEVMGVADAQDCDKEESNKKGKGK